MALGGGTFVVQNKELAGTYINFVSAKRASNVFSDRGFVTMGLELDWGKEGEVFEVTSEYLIKNARELFGYDYSSEKVADIRDIFLGATTLYAYRLNGGGEKASNKYATAKYCGIRGNDLKVVIQANVDVPENFDVSTYLGNTLVDVQTVASVDKLVDNQWVTWKEQELEVTAGIPLTGGTNGEVNGEAHTAYLTAIESYNFNTIAYKGTEETIKKLYVAFTKRMRDEVGVKFQCVLFNYKANYEGVINVKNCVEVVPWVLGAEGGCLVNKSCTNKIYDGEAVVPTAYTQTQLKEAIRSGELAFHKVGNEIRVLTDINSYTEFTEEKNSDFAKNQTMRVLDQIGNDIATIFNSKYIGKVQNDEAGRISLWVDIVKHHNTLLDLRAIENFTDKDVQVFKGETKDSVTVYDVVCPVNAMEKLYMTVTVA